jgi:choice-of-anchor C domain-containing protein
MTSSVVRAFGLFASALVASASFSQNLVVNGGFEIGADQQCGWVCIGAGSSGLNGWTVETSSVDRQRNGSTCPITESWVAFEGVYSVDLKGCDPYGGAISQLVPTEPGRSYRLEFQLTANCAGDPTKVVSVRCGSLIRSFSKTCSGSGLQSWTTCQVNFVAESNQTLIGFQAIGNDGSWNGPVIDAVSVIPTCQINGVLPVSGPAQGGTSITITGDQFGPAPLVKIGDVPAAQVSRVSAQRLVVVTPPNLPGMASISIDGTVAENAFYYRPECGSDLDQDGEVTAADIAIVLLDFGPCYVTATSPQTDDSKPFMLQDQPAPVVPQSR